MGKNLMGAGDLEKFRCFQISKNHNSVNFCRKRKSYLKKVSEYYFLLRKKLKNPNREKKLEFKLEKIATRKILIVNKNPIRRLSLLTLTETCHNPNRNGS